MVNTKKNITISDETIKEIANIRRSREYEENYNAIEEALEILAANLYLVSDNEDTQISLDIVDDDIVCHIKYPDGGQRRWKVEIDYKY